MFTSSRVQISFACYLAPNHFQELLGFGSWGVWMD